MQNPEFIYGTAWKEDRTAELVNKALASGFTAIDTANQRKHYHEAGVGEALKTFFAAGGNRGSLWLQSKYTLLSQEILSAKPMLPTLTGKPGARDLYQRIFEWVREQPLFVFK